MNRINTFFLYAIVILLIPTYSYATPPPDESLPIEITADSLEVKETQGISIYRGSVKVVQGTTQITGDKVTLTHPAGQIEKAIAIGNQGTFKRFLPEEQSWIEGQANKITFLVIENKVIFVGQAFIYQAGKSSIRGSHITYDLNTRTLAAKSTEDDPQRVKMIFYPEKETH